MQDNYGTVKFTPIVETECDADSILHHVYLALKDKGYDPVTQLVGYLMSGDPTYITSHNHARGMIGRVYRDDIMEALVRNYIKGMGNDGK